MTIFTSSEKYRFPLESPQMPTALATVVRRAGPPSPVPLPFTLVPEGGEYLMPLYTTKLRTMIKNMGCKKHAIIV